MTQSDHCEILEITKSTTLDPRCTYRTIRITRSDVVLDCAGATIDAAYETLYGIQIGRTEGLGEVRNVTVRNCTVRRANKHGIYIGAAQCDADKLKLPEKERYRQHSHDILLEGVTVELSGNSGLYVDDYVSNVTVRKSAFVRNARLGIYLEHHSRGARITGNRFVENGHGPRFVPVPPGNREAIAIDASQHNLIDDNDFIDNYAGAIFLYRNCWEQPQNPCQVKRDQGAEYNVIRGNRIEGGRIGIWVASRQHRSADKPNCGLRPDPVRGIYNDDAKHNLVTGNRIVRAARGIVVEDDDNVIENNEIVASRTACIVAGSDQRITQFGAPVRKLRIAGNSCVMPPLPEPDRAISIVPGTDAELKNNRVTGRR